MCNLNKIGLLIGAASAPIIVAVVFLAASFINANSLYTVLGNGIVLGVSAVFLVLSSSSIALAIKEVDGCVQGRCSALAETLRNALIAIGVSLAIAITAVIIGMLFGSIPYVGGGVCIALAVMAAAIGVCPHGGGRPAQRPPDLPLCIGLAGDWSGRGRGANDSSYDYAGRWLLAFLSLRDAVTRP